MLKKKTTVVIDHQAEERAKQQAMQAELDALKPKPKTTDKPQDHSVETNRSSLNKVKKRTLKTIGLVVLGCAVISLVVWAVLHKNYLDKLEKERATKQAAEKVAIEKADNVLNKKDFNYPECQLSSEKARTECENQKQYDKATDVLKETKGTLPAKKSNELLQQLIYIASTSANDTERLNKLDELAKEIKQNSGADHLTYFRLSNSYRPVDKLASLKYMKKAKELYENQDKNSSNYDIDSYDFDRNIEDIQAEINAKKD
jgi:hypothetical protein